MTPNQRSFTAKTPTAYTPPIFLTYVGRTPFSRDPTEGLFNEGVIYQVVDLQVTHNQQAYGLFIFCDRENIRIWESLTNFRTPTMEDVFGGPEEFEVEVQQPT